MYRVDESGKIISGIGSKGKAVKVLEERDLTETILLRLKREDKLKIVSMLKTNGYPGIAPGIVEILLKLALPEAKETLSGLKSFGVAKSRYGGK